MLSTGVRVGNTVTLTGQNKQPLIKAFSRGQMAEKHTVALFLSPVKVFESCFRNTVSGSVLVIKPRSAFLL